MREECEISSCPTFRKRKLRETHLDIAMAYSQRLMQTPYDARQLLQHAPGKVERQDSAWRARYELLECHRRPEAFFNEVEVTWCANGLENLP